MRGGGWGGVEPVHVGGYRKSKARAWRDASVDKKKSCQASMKT